MSLGHNLKKVYTNILEKKKVNDKYYYTKDCYFYKELKETMKSKETVYQWRRKYVISGEENM